MSTPDSQQRLKDEAKALKGRIEAFLDTKNLDRKTRVVRTTCIYAGMLTETLVEYEEPDVVMEQAFYRLADLLRTQPAEEIDEGDLMPLGWSIDHDTEIGRQIARAAAKNLPKGLDDVHEIAIALIIDDLPVWEKEGFAKDIFLRLLIEMVITSLSFEMATQDFCDLLIEEFIADGHSATEALLGLAAVAGSLYAAAGKHYVLPEGAEQEFTNVMVRESVLHGTPGGRNWQTLAAANDVANVNFKDYMEKIKPEVKEFFDLIGLEDPLAQAVSVAKAVGRMVAVITVEDVGQTHPSIAKSLAKTGMILGSKSETQASA